MNFLGIIFTTIKPLFRKIIIVIKKNDILFKKLFNHNILINFLI